MIEELTVIEEKKKTLQIDSAAFSDPGLERDLNQDVVFHQTGQTGQNERIGLFLVCDGMGGHQGGEIASRIAVDTITGELAEIFSTAQLFSNQEETHPSYLTLANKVERAVQRANEEIRCYAQKHPNSTPELGTTVTLALIYGRLAHIVSIGDSRVYAWREGEIKQITRDHSFAAKLVEKGIIEETEIAHHPSNNVILRALGIDPNLEIDVFDWTLQPGDKLLLCSDGLWKSLNDLTELARWLGAPTTAADLCQQLVAQAKARDGSDNISAIVINVDESEC